MKLDLFWTLVIILLVIWALGLIEGLGNLIHLLLIIAVIVVLYRFFTGRNVVTGK